MSRTMMMTTKEYRVLHVARLMMTMKNSKIRTAIQISLITYSVRKVDKIPRFIIHVKLVKQQFHAAQYTPTTKCR